MDRNRIVGRLFRHHRSLRTGLRGLRRLEFLRARLVPAPVGAGIVVLALAGCLSSPAPRPIGAQVRAGQASDRAVAAVEENARAAAEATRAAAQVRRPAR